MKEHSLEESSSLPSMSIDLPIASITFPVSEATLRELIDAQNAGHTTAPILQQCSSLELAGLCVLNSAVKSAVNSAVKSLGNGAEKNSEKTSSISIIKLERALGVVAEDMHDGGDSATQPVIKSLRSSDWKHILSLLPSMNIELMAEREMNTNALLSDQGAWDSAAQQHKEYEERAPLYRNDNIAHTFSIHGLKQHDEQDILLQELARNPEESLTLQGFAGTGKTTLVARLSHLFNDYSTLYLTKNMGQVKAITPKLGESIKAWTFEYLAYYILYYKWNGRDYWGRRIELRPGHSKVRKLTYYQIARIIQAVPMNGFTADTVAKIVDQIVSNYCVSSDVDIGPQHCPWQLNDISPALYVELAKTYWKEIKKPDVMSDIPVLGIHQIKIVEENELVIPNNFRTIIVDESHDLTGSMRNILKRSTQAIITLGDQFQRTEKQSVGGRSIAPFGASATRDRHLFQSMRVGNNVDSLFNELLSQHKALDLPGTFQGVSARQTSIKTYTEFSPPDYACAMLSRDYWYAFIAIIQLAEANRPFVVMPLTLTVLRTLIPQALSYLHGFHEQRGHSQLMGYKNWSELVQMKGQTNGLSDVDIYFRKGFTANMFAGILERQTTVYTPDCYYVGLASEAKSKEMSQVMLAPDIFDSYMLENKEQRTRMLNLIYTAMSRALDGIILPEKESAWLLEA